MAGKLKKKEGEGNFLKSFEGKTFIKRISKKGRSEVDRRGLDIEESVKETKGEIKKVGEREKEIECRVKEIEDM